VANGNGISVEWHMANVKWHIIYDAVQNLFTMRLEIQTCPHPSDALALYPCNWTKR